MSSSRGRLTRVESEMAAPTSLSAAYAVLQSLFQLSDAEIAVLKNATAEELEELCAALGVELEPPRRRRRPSDPRRREWDSW